MKKTLIISSLLVFFPILAQASTICTETIVNGQSVRRCVTGTKPYTAPIHPPTINTPFIPINPPAAPSPPPSPSSNPNPPSSSPNLPNASGTILTEGVRTYSYVPVGTVESLPFTLPPDWHGIAKITVTEGTSPNDAARYTAWISTTPNGPEVGNSTLSFQYTGGSITITDPAGPWWNRVKLPGGTYYYNLRSEVSSDKHYIQMNMSLCVWQGANCL